MEAPLKFNFIIECLKSFIRPLYLQLKVLIVLADKNDFLLGQTLFIFERSYTGYKVIELFLKRTYRHFISKMIFAKLFKLCMHYIQVSFQSGVTVSFFLDPLF